MDAAVAAIEEDGGATEGSWTIPNGWKWIPLGRLGTWMGGGTPSKANHAFWSNGTVPWVSPKDMKIAVIGETEDKITADAVKNSSAKYVPEGSVLMVMRSGILRHSFPVAVTDRIVTLNQDLRALTPHEGVTPDYIARYLALAANRVLNDCSKDGTTVNSIEVAALERLPVPLAALAEQRRIVTRIDALFAEIAEGEAALEAARKGLDTFRRALLKAAVTGELTKDWRAANPAAETGHDVLARIAKDRARIGEPKGRPSGGTTVQPLDASALPVLPKSWAWARVGEVISRMEYGTSEKCDFGFDGVPVLRMGNVDFGSLTFAKLKYAPKESMPPILQVGDLVFNRTNSAELVGKCAVYKGDISPCSLASYLIRVRFDDTSPDFAALWINSAFGRKWIAANKSQQVGQANLSGGTLRSMYIPIPPPAEAAEILRRVSEAHSAAADTLALLDAEAADAARLKQSILKAAFEGRLMPQDPADEPASALLARLAANAPAIRAKRGRVRKSDA
jgi:type I restriction enzyme S subunit